MFYALAGQRRVVAFALPTVVDGYIRLNVRGREAQGIVSAADYSTVCDELTAEVSRLVDPRSGKPVVREVVRVREWAFDDDPKKPPADLIVVFQDERALDVVESPLVGRIGPLPFFRSGGHHAGGVTHAEINRLLGSATYPELRVEFHDFSRLMRDGAYAAQTLGGVDCVLCNVGPHAHYYHHLRERLGLNFRIVRDIKTALWSGYLLQESLCQPYLRAGDALLATSNYSRVLTRHLFPHLEGSTVHLFEPVLAAPQDHSPALAIPPPASEGMTTLGYVGRLSEDKNFPQAVDLLIALDPEQPGQHRLVAVGAVHSPMCEPGLIAERVRAATGRDDLFVYVPPVGHEKVRSLLSAFDYFLFFSTSNLEVLGRVLVEAADAKVPVLAANHATAPELLAAASLLDVTYALDREFHSHFDAPLGCIDVETAANRIRQREIPQAPSRSTINRPETLLAVLAGRPHDVADGASLELALAQREYLARMRWYGLPRFLARDATGPVIETLSHWFCAVNGRAGSDFESRLAELERRSPFKERTRRFIAGTKSTRCDFTNLGGIDIELCNIAGYYPRFKLASSASDSVPPISTDLDSLSSLPLAFSTLHQRS